VTTTQSRRGCTQLARCVVASALLLVASNSIAASWDDFIAGEHVDADSREYRVALAKDLAREILALYDATPALTPDQAKCVESEKKRIERIKDPATQMKQTITFQTTKAPLIDIAKGGLSNQLSTLRCIEESPQHEMTCWTQLIVQLLPEVSPYWAINVLSTHYGVAYPQTGYSILFTDRSDQGGTTATQVPHVWAIAIARHLLLPYVAKQERVPAR